MQLTPFPQAPSVDVLCPAGGLGAAEVWGGGAREVEVVVGRGLDDVVDVDVGLGDDVDVDVDVEVGVGAGVDADVDVEGCGSGSAETAPLQLPNDD
jgi:hypothetical protein